MVGFVIIADVVIGHRISTVRWAWSIVHLDEGGKRKTKTPSVNACEDFNDTETKDLDGENQTAMMKSEDKINTKKANG